MTIKNVTKTKPATKAPAKVVSRNITLRKTDAKAATKAVAQKPGLFFFQMVPSGKLMRAYFTGLIVAQCGGVVANKTFRLWPNANVKGHTESNRLKKVEGKGCYQLSAAGVNYLTHEEHAAAKDTVQAMVQAIKTGKPPAFYNYEMSPLS